VRGACLQLCLRFWGKSQLFIHNLKASTRGLFISLVLVPDLYSVAAPLYYFYTT